MNRCVNLTPGFNVRQKWKKTILVSAVINVNTNYYWLDLLSFNYTFSVLIIIQFILAFKSLQNTIVVSEYIFVNMMLLAWTHILLQMSQSRTYLKFILVEPKINSNWDAGKKPLETKYKISLFIQNCTQYALSRVSR